METSAPKYSIVIPVPKSATDQQMARYSDYRAFDKIDREKASVELLSFDIGSDLSDISKQFKSVKFKPFDLAVYGAESTWSHDAWRKDNPIDIYFHVADSKGLKSFRDYLAKHFSEQNRKVNRTPFVMLLRHLSSKFDEFAEAVTTFERDPVSFSADLIELRMYETLDNYEVIASVKLK
jgi:2'-5' RNA ligase